MSDEQRTEHTPGPWVTVNSDDPNLTTRIEGPGHVSVVTHHFTCRPCPGCGDPHYVDGCPKCGYGGSTMYPDPKPNARCRRCGAVRMPFVGYI